MASFDAGISVKQIIAAVLAIFTALAIQSVTLYSVQQKTIREYITESKVRDSYRDKFEASSDDLHSSTRSKIHDLDTRVKILESKR